MAKEDESANVSSESKASRLASKSTREAPPDRLAVLTASNQFLNREISSLEKERDALRRELTQIKNSYAGKIIERYRRWITRNRNNAAIRFYESIALWILNRIVGPEEKDSRKRYQLWLNAHELTTEGLEAIAMAAASFPYRPLVSVYLSVGSDSIEKFLNSAIESVRTQLYENWELCLVNDQPHDRRIEAMLDRHATNDRRIKLKRTIDGEFVVFLSQHGELSRDSIFELVKQLNRDPLADFVYWDDDQLDADGSACAPFFKPDWSPDLILSMNYVGESFAARRSLIDEAGGIRSEDGAQWVYDLVLRGTERTERIVHIPKVLYHQRGSDTSSQGAGAIEETIRRRGIGAKVETAHPGRYSVRYEIRDNPMVSILIPTKDNCRLLRQCIDSIGKKTDYPNYEIIVMDNDSSDRETLDYFARIAHQVRIVRCPGRFNFSAINNRGAAQARGEFLLFLNNDTEVSRPDWMRAMVEQAQRLEVGAVGAKLLFSDGRIQHAGVVLGIEGVVGHAFRLVRDDSVRGPALANVVRDCSAVTAACMMMRRSLFDEVGGFDETLPIDFNDVDLCLRLRRLGYAIVYTPLALLYHHESATRGHFHLPKYQDLFLQRWGRQIRNGDPYYNRNLTLIREDWSVAL